MKKTIILIAIFMSLTTSISFSGILSAYRIFSKSQQLRLDYNKIKNKKDKETRKNELKNKLRDIISELIEEISNLSDKNKNEKSVKKQLKHELILVSNIL